MTVRRLGAGSFWVLADFVSPEPRDPWVRESEDFLAIVAPTQMGDASGSTIVQVSDAEGELIAAAAYRPHQRLYATHLQCFVVAPRLRGHGFAQRSFEELLEWLRTQGDSPDFVTWAVREENAPMLRVSSHLGEGTPPASGLIHFHHP